jgi:DNA-3-methyladenine glycosylase
MFGPAGIAYVYFVYGMYHCLNVVTESDGVPGALLVRAVEAVSGAERMRAARIDWLAARSKHPTDAELERARVRLSRTPDSALASGPGLVCAAFGIDSTVNGMDLCDSDSPFRLEPAPTTEPRPTIATGPRIGINYAPEPWLSRPWRFWIEGNPAVSGRRVRAGTRAAGPVSEEMPR